MKSAKILCLAIFNKILLLISLSLVASTSYAESPSDAPLISKTEITKRWTKVSWAVDYNSWFENILVKNSTSSYETQAMLYGIGVSVELNQYFPTWGWGVSGGILQGFAVVGDSSSSTNYYARRVTLNSLRGTGRLIYRVNPRLDLGLGLAILSKTQSWPTDKGFTVDSNSLLVFGYFLDSRWRVDKNWELLQAIGTYSKSSSAAWRLGASYTY